MRNYLIAGIITLFVGTAIAGIPPASQPGATSSGGFTAGQDVTGDDGVFKTLQSTGTAPSLTATGAKFTNKVEVASNTLTVNGTNAFIGTNLAPTVEGDFVKSDNTTTNIVRMMANALTQGLCFTYDKFHKCGTTANTDLKIDASGTGNLLLQNQASAGNVGIGDLSPSEKLEVAGGIAHYPRTIAQLLAITPSQAGVSYFCSNCSPAKLVVSTGTSAGNFADAIGGPFQ